MNKQELIKHFEEMPYVSVSQMGRKAFIDMIEQLDEPENGHADEAPRYVKNILARLRELPLHDREVWLKTIMGEFEQDFSRAKWREGYEQGKVEGLIEREKVTIPQFVAEWIWYCKNTNVTMTRALLIGEVDFYNYANQKDYSRLIDFLGSGVNQETFAHAWLDGYEVEKEKRYLVKVIGLGGLYECLNFDTTEKIWKFFDCNNTNRFRIHHTRKELEKAGFGWVFDCEGIEIEEVTE